MEVKAKKCKGINKANGFAGCGTMSLYRTYGLCPKCLSNWFDTEPGKIAFEKLTLSASKKVKTAKNKEERKAKVKNKLELMSPDKYRSTYLQPKINEIVRLIDYGHPCIATGNQGKMNAGHYVSVGANRTICLNLHNIFIQSFQSNHWKSGDTKKYQLGLIETFGLPYYEYVNSLSKHKAINLSKEEMQEIAANARGIIKELKQDLKIRTAQQRIDLRNEINLRLNIYDPEFCEYVITQKTS